MAYGESDGLGYFTSGAGGDDKTPACGGCKWGKGGVYGFLTNKVKDGKLYSRYYYVYHGQTNFHTWDAPVHDLVSGEIEARNFEN